MIQKCAKNDVSRGIRAFFVLRKQQTFYEIFATKKSKNPFETDKIRKPKIRNRTKTAKITKRKSQNPHRNRYKTETSNQKPALKPLQQEKQNSETRAETAKIGKHQIPDPR